METLSFFEYNSKINKYLDLAKESYKNGDIKLSHENFKLHFMEGGTIGKEDIEIYLLALASNDKPVDISSSNYIYKLLVEDYWDRRDIHSDYINLDENDKPRNNSDWLINQYLINDFVDSEILENDDRYYLKYLPGDSDYENYMKNDKNFICCSSLLKQKKMVLEYNTLENMIEDDPRHVLWCIINVYKFSIDNVVLLHPSFRNLDLLPKAIQYNLIKGIMISNQEYELESKFTGG